MTEPTKAEIMLDSVVSCKYIAEAFTKFRAILQVKGDTENE